MQRPEPFRVVASLAIAAGGAGLALLGAAVTGNLGGGTTIEEIAAVPPVIGTGVALATPSGGLSVERIYRLDAPGVVQITATSVETKTDPFGFFSPKAETRQALGSGFVIDKAGHIVTNNHVIAGAQTVQVSFSGHDEIVARVIGKDPVTDVAVLQVDAHSRSLTPLPLGDSDEVKVGDPVVAIGNPFSLTRTATAGIVSALRRTIDAPNSASTIDHAIQTDAAINHGNSGGPLINARGEVIGVNSQIRTGSGADGNVGIGFAIPINTVKTVVAQLIRVGKVQHAFLGAGAVAVTPDLARTFNLPVSHGLLVQHVVPGSGAEKAGLLPGRTPVVVAGESYRLGGDIIVRADQAPVSSEAHLRAVIERKKPGEGLSLEIWRDGRKQHVHVTLGQPPG
jgi:S1-C subfamily serine protease